MISVWPKFYPGTGNFEAMRARGFLYESTLRSGFKDWVGPGYPYAFFDAFNPEARLAKPTDAPNTPVGKTLEPIVERGPRLYHDGEAGFR